jgi:hypothetical protein
VLYVIARRLSFGGTRPSHITHLRVQDSGETTSNIWSKQTLVDWIDGTDGTGRRGVAKVHNAYGVDPVVHTVHPAHGDPYVQTQPDNTTTDNLLSLPPC